MIGTALECIAWLSTQREGTFEVDFHKEKRSLSANSLYWKCVGRIGQAMKEPNAYVHNFMLRQLGIYEIYDGEVARVLLRDTDEVERQTMYDPENHLMPERGERGLKIINGERYRWYALLKHSSDFDKSEMSRLIDAITEQMRNMGLVPPQDEDIHRAIELYEKHRKKES